MLNPSPEGTSRERTLMWIYLGEKEIQGVFESAQRRTSTSVNNAVYLAGEGGAFEGRAVLGQGKLNMNA